MRNKFTISYLAGTKLRLAVCWEFHAKELATDDDYRVQSASLRLALYFGERKAHEKGSRCFFRRRRNRRDFSLHSDTG
jgi:hypothetical protein